ncbi:unnamed protein product [Sphagnum troendelagicum]|uniref:Uncharacterized protein n=1 Tax=Sphagnum troendelagicum TaxID=128251 RepID=A0ABP0TCR7_9BRYO
MAAAVIARRIAALPPHERGNLTERSSSFYTSKPHEEQQAEELQKEFYEEEFDPVRFMLQDIPKHEVKQSFFDHKVANLPASAHCHEIIVFENDQLVRGFCNLKTSQRSCQSKLWNIMRRWVIFILHTTKQDL